MPSGAESRAIGLIAREPVSGMVKTRLAPALGDDAAARLYAAMLRDTFLAAARVPDSRTVVFHPPEDSAAAIRRLAPPGTGAEPDSGGDLGQVMAGAIVDLLDGGASAVAIIGADVPLLTPGDIAAAFHALERDSADVVIGPADDGGYYLIATRAPQPGLFTGVDWGTGQVLEQTLDLAARSGLRVMMLDSRYDLDDFSDLRRLAADLRSDGRLAADATRAALHELDAFDVELPAGPLPWTVRGSRSPFASPWRTLVVDEVKTHTGEVVEYSYLEATEAVWVVPVTSDGEIILIRQYRHPVRSWSVEVPAGSGDEDLVSVAERELREEIGGRASEIRRVNAYYPAAAHVTVRGNVCLALGVVLGPAEREPTELLVPFAVPADVAFDMARHGEISDAQSAIAVLACEQEIRAWLEEERR